MIDGRKNVNHWLGFEFQSSHVIENRNKLQPFLSLMQAGVKNGMT